MNETKIAKRATPVPVMRATCQCAGVMADRSPLVIAVRQAAVDWPR
jgi:hypothetical protein